MRIASDIGGTFTDLVFYDARSGEFGLAKVSTTPDDFARGVLETIERAGVATSEARFFVHGSTDRDRRQSPGWADQSGLFPRW